jgi:hypothetical protein
MKVSLGPEEKIRGCLISPLRNGSCLELYKDHWNLQHFKGAYP